ncbi:uncharacterized protein PG986_013205 [Apiospora aurea]|uniref:Uncharacterized protein n=1 Tax=Apiospora aurea TaxID=335848 RepID=A0ABR1PUX8_9PEZI
MNGAQHGSNDNNSKPSTTTPNKREHEEACRRRLDQDEQSKLRRDLSVSRCADPDLLAEDSASCVAPPPNAEAKSDVTTWSQMMKKGRM